MPTPSSPTAAALLTLCLGLTAHPLCADSLDPLELPTVLSATRLKQAPADVPGSMTVLDRELIRASGARNIPEILRLVPGMHVGYRRGNQMNVNLRSEERRVGKECRSEGS